MHTTVSPNTYKTLKKLAITYGSISNVIEEALKLLKIRVHMLDNLKKSELDEYQLWHLMRTDFNMLAVGRTTFLSYIDKIPTEPQENNNCVELIEWFYDNRPINRLTLYEILTAIKQIWIAGNYFWKIQVKAQDEKSQNEFYAKKFEMSFFYHFSEKTYGVYWSEYFKTVLAKPPLNCKCDITLRNESFYMVIEQT
ncbi:MAG: hypothetical protein ACTSUK_06330 [Promethearchaeota archaeon]